MKGEKTNAGARADAAGRQADKINKILIFENCALFTNCISKINNTLIDNAKDMDVVMSMYNLIEYSNNYLKSTGSLWQYYKDGPVFNNAAITESESLKSKVRITGNTPRGFKGIIKFPHKMLSFLV